MPIPGLSVKTTSPQSWKKKNHRPRLRSGGSSFGKNIPGRRKSTKFKIPFHPPEMPKNIAKIVLILGVLIITFGGVSGLAVVGWVARDLPDPNKIIDRSVAESTKIYDRTGETLLFDIHGTEQRTVVKLEDIPEFVVQATLVAEDRNFYEHRGISLTGILRSVWKNLTTGSRVGGSTLTQQLVKNAVLSPEKTYTRKIKEILLSWQIEKRFSKDEILQLYFNEIPYGSVAYGAEAAAQTYFGKGIKDVSLAEAAILAALPQAPTYYSPYGSHLDALFARQAWVLDSMAEVGYITKEDANFSKNEKIDFKVKQDNITAPHFVMHVREYLTEKYGDLAVEQGGLQVITTLDLFKHNMAEEIITEMAEKNLAWNANNAAMVVIDPKTGQILTMIGSKDYFNEEIDGQVNVATRLRQPGSSFKPLVYAAALKKGYTPQTILYDVVTTFQNYDLADYEPKNYDLVEHGPVTMAKALAGSLNIPAVKTIYLTGVDNVIDLAEDLGYTSLGNRSRFGLSLVLGGGEVQLLEHVNAFAALAREGLWHPPVAILEVKDKDGNVLEEYKEVEKKALSTQVSRQINKMMSDNDARAYIFGQSNFLNLGARPVAAKTGTTNDYHDAWTVGYTPSLAVGVWVGNNDNEAMKRGADGSVVAAPTWHAFMSKVLGSTPIEYFKDPEPTQSDKPVLNGSITEGQKIKINKANGKIATNQTPESLVEEKTFKELHSILHYINKDDPQGSTPPDQSSEQYTRWEAAIKRWAEGNNYATEAPPTEFDDSFNDPQRPTISILSPTERQVITNRNFTATVKVSAARKINRVEYYLNEKLLKVVNDPPYTLNVTIEDPYITDGFYQFKALAYDETQSSGGDVVELNMRLPSAPPTLSWVSPKENQNLSTTNFPVSIEAKITNATNVSKIDLYYRSDSSQDNYINTARQFPDDKLIVQWSSSPPLGDYFLFATITNNNGYSYNSSELSLIIK